VDDLTTGTGMNAFLWNRVGQGFSSAVEDAPPQESWRAWSRGHRDHKVRVVPYRTTPTSSKSSSSPAPRKLRGEHGPATPGQQTRPHRRHADPQLAQSASAGGAAMAMGTALARTESGSEFESESEAASAAADVVTVMGEERSVAGTTGVASTTTVVAASSESVSSSGTTLGKGPAGAGYCASIGDEGEEGVVAEEEKEEDGDDYDHDHDHDHDDDLGSGMDYEDVLTADLSGPPRSREWALPFPRSRSEQTSPEASQARSARLRTRQISLKINAPDDLELTVIQCTFSRVEDVGENCSKRARTFHSRLSWLNCNFLSEPKLKVVYASKPSTSHSQAPSESR